MPHVVLRPNETQDQLLRRFRTQVVRSGNLGAVREKRWFISKSEKRRIEKKNTIRNQKNQRYYREH